MGSHSLRPPLSADDRLSRNGTSTRLLSGGNRASKHVKRAAASTSHRRHVSSLTSTDMRHRRVWKACVRCRMKKTKCDGEFPCKRCKDDSMVCTVAARRKDEYKQPPKGYVEILETTQFALVATVHKLYSMVRNSQPWTLGEPELNDRGEPIIHDIAQTLDCIRPNTDIDFPMHSVFPQDVAGMADLAHQLDEQQQKPSEKQTQQANLDIDSSVLTSGRADRAVWSNLQDSDSEQDYILSGCAPATQNYQSVTINRCGVGSGLTLTPQSFSNTTAASFDMSPVTDINTNSLYDRPASLDHGVEGCYNLRPISSEEQSDSLPIGFFKHDDLQWPGVPNHLVEAVLSNVSSDVILVPNPDFNMGNNELTIYSGSDEMMP